MSGFRRSKLEQWQEEAAKNLSDLVTRERIGQEALRQRLGVRQASQVSQLLSGLRPISVHHAAAFADAIGCRVDDFSVELANQIRQLASKVAWTPTGKRYWPFHTRPDDYENLSPERKREIANYIAERVALAKLEGGANNVPPEGGAEDLGPGRQRSSTRLRQASGGEK